MDNDDIHHANNLSLFLCGTSGVNAFILVKNGTNIRLRSSLQSMIESYQNTFGIEDFWSHLIIIFTNIEPHLIDEI